MKWILRYVKGTINTGLMFDRDKAITYHVTQIVDSDYSGGLDGRESILFVRVLSLKKHLFSLL